VTVVVERVAEPTPELIDAFTRLLPQLSRGSEVPELDALAEMLAATGANLFVARDDDGKIGRAHV